MGSSIYWIAVLSKLGKMGIGICLIAMVYTVVMIVVYIEDHNNIEHYIGRDYIPENIEILKSENKSMWNKVSIGIVVAILGASLAVFIPSKQDMYAIALTKDVEAGQIYEMTKEELKSGIDYFFNKLNELNK